MKSKNLNTIIGSVTLVILAATLIHTIDNNIQLKRPYIEIQRPEFTFYNSEEKEIKDLYSEEIVKFKTSFSIINHGELPAIITQSGVGLRPYNQEFDVNDQGLNKYEGQLVTIFNGSPRSVDTGIQDIEPFPEFLTFLEYFRDMKKESIPAKADMYLYYKVALNYEEMFNEDKKSFFGLTDKVYEARNIANCFIKVSGVICESSVTTPGGRKKIFRGQFYYLPGSHKK